MIHVILHYLKLKWEYFTSHEFISQHQDDFVGFFCGSFLSTIAASSVIENIIHFIVAAFFGGFIGVLGKEAATRMIKGVAALRNIFKK